MVSGFSKTEFYVDNTVFLKLQGTPPSFVTRQDGHPKHFPVVTGKLDYRKGWQLQAKYKLNHL